jgi:hypothetical protein
MTFKHIDFDSSPTMRSLARLATEKGWAKDEPIQKTAAPQLDLNPSDDFTDNLMKLCSGLRRSGFEKQADELEDKFIQYKRANALYNISGEEGEDLVHAAHPKGSHKMENIDSSEATFEDILDKHLKTLNVVNKQPTGKLASSNDLINAVGRVVLGAGPLVSSAGVGNIDFGGGGLWERVSNMLRSPIVLATPEASAGEAASAGAISGAAMATGALISAVIGGLIGNAIFEHQFYVNDLESAGKNLIGGCKEVESDISSSEIHTEAKDFEYSFNEALVAAKKASDLVKSPSPENLQGLQDYASKLQEASNKAYKIMAMAREMYSGSGKMKPGEIRQEHWYNQVFDRTTALFGTPQKLRSIEIYASNFINVAQKAISDARLIINKILQTAKEKADQGAKQYNNGGVAADQLIQAYTDAKSYINRVYAYVRSNRLGNATEINEFLKSINDYIDAERKEFDEYGEQKSVAAPAFMSRFNSNVKPGIDALKAKWGNLQ